MGPLNTVRTCANERLSQRAIALQRMKRIPNHSAYGMAWRLSPVRAGIHQWNGIVGRRPQIPLQHIHHLKFESPPHEGSRFPGPMRDRLKPFLYEREDVVGFHTPLDETACKQHKFQRWGLKTRVYAVTRSPGASGALAAFSLAGLTPSSKYRPAATSIRRLILSSMSRLGLNPTPF